MVRTVMSLLVVLALCSAARAQFPGDLIDVSTDSQSPEWCGIDHLYTLLPGDDPLEMSGASCADFDGDGWIDVFLGGGAGQASKLYRNLGNGAFADEAAARGVTDPAVASAAGVFVDYDNDGDLDLVVGVHAGNSGTPLALFKLFRNGGAAHGHAFEDVTGSAGFVKAPTVRDTLYGWQGGVAAGDYDRDGYVDLFGTWWTAHSLPDHGMWRLFRSEPNPAPGDPSDPTYTPRVFVDATIDAGLDFAFVGEPWQPMFMDVDRDGWLDLHVCVDFEYDYMFRNEGDGTFSEVAMALGLNGSPPEKRNEMGSATGDVDNDGSMDLHVTNLFESDRFYRADLTPGGVSYTDVALATGLHDSAWGWGNVFFDVDNDGDLDHATVSGYTVPSAQGWYNNLQLNLFPQKLLDGVTVAWQNATFFVPQFSKIQTFQGDSARGLSYLDYDNDGDLDLVVTRNKDKAAFYRNTLSSSNRWLQVDLVEAGGSLNTVGARVWVKTSDRVQMREVIAGSSFQSQEPPRLHFGLGPGEVGAPPARVDDGASGSGARSQSGSKAAPTGGLVGAGPPPLGGSGATLPVTDPAWLVVRWMDGGYTTVMSPGSNRILTVARGARDDAGDMDADGHLTPTDKAMLLLLATDPATFAATYPGSPGRIVGDIDGNGFVELADYQLWSALDPH